MEWLRIQFDAGDTNILYALYADHSGNTESPQDIAVERKLHGRIIWRFKCFACSS